MPAGDLESSDIYGAVATINFVDLTGRFALTSDFAQFRPVEGVDRPTVHLTASLTADLQLFLDAGLARA